MPIPSDLTNLPRVNRGNLAKTDPNKSIIFSGPSGSGKTYASLSAPGPIISIYTDPNRETAKQQMQTREDGAIEVWPLSDWATYEDTIVPGVRNRLLEETFGVPKVATVVVDTIDFLAEMMWNEIQGTRNKMPIHEFGTGLRKLATTTRDLVNATRPLPSSEQHPDGHPGYNFI